MPDGPGFRDPEMKLYKPDKRKFGNNNFLKLHSTFIIISSYILDIVCHAEMNAIVGACRRQADLSGSTLYTTLSPCEECCKLILQCKIKHVVWAEEYPEEVKENMELKESAKW